MIKIRELSKYYQDVCILNKTFLEVSVGEIVCLQGPSGIGKSTLLRCINQLESFDGEIIVDGVTLSKDTSRRDKKIFQRKVGMVFQDYNLFPHLTAMENILLAIDKKERSVVQIKARELLSKMGIDDKENAYPSKLSGGQQQKVAIIRACVLEPKVICFDEPTSALDSKSIAEVTMIIQELSKSMAIIIVTHDNNFAQTIATKVIELKDNKLMLVDR